MPPTLKTERVNEHVFHAGIAPLLNLHFRSRLLAGFLAALLHVPGLSYGLAGGWQAQGRGKTLSPFHPFALPPFHHCILFKTMLFTFSPVHTLHPFILLSFHHCTKQEQRSSFQSFTPSHVHARTVVKLFSHVHPSTQSTFTFFA